MSGTQKYSTEDISRAAVNVRKRALRLALDHKHGYLSQVCSIAEILAALYMRVLHMGESLGDPAGEQFSGVPGPGNKNALTGARYHGPVSAEYDRYIHSPPHYGTAVYCMLVECGRLAPEALEHFDKDGWKLELISAEHSPGFECMTGSLGQAISVAGGIAHARKKKGDKGRVICLISDGEAEEGQIWEAVQSAAALKLDNFIIYLVANGQQCEADTIDVLGLTPDDFANRFKAFGAVTVTVDGHDVDAIAAAADTPHTGKPLAVVCRTNATQGIPLLERNRSHYNHIKFDAGELAEYEAFYAQM